MTEGMNTHQEDDRTLPGMKEQFDAFRLQQIDKFVESGTPIRLLATLTDSPFSSLETEGKRYLELAASKGIRELTFQAGSYTITVKNNGVGEI